MTIIEQFQKIVDEWQYGPVGDLPFVDGFSASIVVSVYKALGPEAQAKFETLSAARALDISYKLHAKFAA